MASIFRIFIMVCAVVLPGAAYADNNALIIPLNRSALVMTEKPMAEVMVAAPEIADVYAHGSSSVSVVAKKFGHTTIRMFDKQGKVMRSLDVTVTYDLPAIRKALKNFLPQETIGVELVNTNIALTGDVSNASVVDQALRIANRFIAEESPGSGGGGVAGAVTGATGGGVAADTSGVVNLMRVAGSQQVMLRVRIGEIQRTALQKLGVDPSLRGVSGNFFSTLALGTAQYGLTVDSKATFLVDQDSYRGTGIFGYANKSGDRAEALVKALEQDGLLKLLAEPNLVAISGEKASFLAGGEIPVPVPQSGGGSASAITIQYKRYGVSVEFTPYVLTQNRVRLEVEPEVSELSETNSVTIASTKVPALVTRRAKTTLELAPGEGFMIAGLISDSSRSSIDQLPGVKDLPILGALFRSTEFQRNETELVIAVTPYIVDPARSSDIKLPSDDFIPATQMDMFFFGELSGRTTENNGESPLKLEGPSGFMTE